MYVDGFLIPVPKRNMATYKRLARAASKVWKELGALEYRECVADDIDVRMMPGVKPQFPAMAKLKKDETLVFSWIVYKSKAHRDRVNKKVMKDPRIIRMMEQKSPFDDKRMAYGGFRMIVDA